MTEIIIERKPEEFYRQVLECEPVPAEDNDIQTLPLPLTRERVEMLLEDDSVSCVKLIIESNL